MSQSAFDALVQDIIRSRDTSQEVHVQEAEVGKSDEGASLTLVSVTTATQEIYGALTQPHLTTAAATRTEELIPTEYDSHELDADKISRPIIQKKAEKREGIDPEMVIIGVKPEKDDDDATRFDVRYGISHGYWKDLLNIPVLGVEGSLHALVQPKDTLNVAKQKPAHNTEDQERARTRRHDTRKKRHEKAVAAFNSNAVYRGLYLTVARLFAEQLKIGLALLESEDLNAKKDISLCAKWASSHDRFHDKHTFIVSSIAEMMYPRADIALGRNLAHRELYLRYAPEGYRKDIAALCAHLDIVERNRSAKTYDKIQYDRVPSLAMNNCSSIFAEHDTERFGGYLKDVAEVREYATHRGSVIMQELAAKVADMQWKMLVRRIKDSGTLESSIAVCDVSGSMYNPIFPDGTRPVDSAIGLLLLSAESVDVSGTLCDKVSQLSQSEWGTDTNFVAVFETLILPMAVRNKLSQEQMVKRVFIFSDMQFDMAQNLNGPARPSFSSSFESIRGKYAEAGYKMPELIFWNLAGGRAGYGQGISGDPTAPKPVTTGEVGTTIVSGYSQAMLKLFLDNGPLDDPEGEDEERDVETMEEGDAVVVDSKPPAKK